MRSFTRFSSTSWETRREVHKSHRTSNSPNHDECNRSGKVLRNPLAFVVEPGNHDGDATNSIELSADQRWLVHLHEPRSRRRESAHLVAFEAKDQRRLTSAATVPAFNARIVSGKCFAAGEAQCDMEI